MELEGRGGPRGGFKARLYLSRTCLYADGNDPEEKRLVILEHVYMLLEMDPEEKRLVIIREGGGAPAETEPRRTAEGLGPRAQRGLGLDRIGTLLQNTGEEKR